jgi:hypothetical protein
MSELALRPASSPSARMPPTALKRREAGSGGHWLRLRGRSVATQGRRLSVGGSGVTIAAVLSPLPSARTNRGTEG